VQADALANWLAQARNNARAVPQEAHLTRSANPRQGNGAPTPTVRWDGTLVLSLPTR
jgi:general secretion pathway protein M